MAFMLSGLRALRCGLRRCGQPGRRPVPLRIGAGFALLALLARLDALVARVARRAVPDAASRVRDRRAGRSLRAARWSAVEQRLHGQLDAALLVGLEHLDAHDLAFLR